MAEPATQDPNARPPRSAEALGLDVDHPRPDAAVLAVSGELDTLTAPELDAALRELVAAPHALLVVDLSGVTFLASSGLAVLIQAAHRAEDSDRPLHLVVTARAVRRPLEITGSDQLFTLHADLATALGH
ncbi:STAS domain-containing protein [Pseudonocardia humida]|uniref:Anti-sigma factor antagonist n=1 Tax=Pseudonocardia humida TaxID=2800819 RepID=A0ABT0ZT80_9PSEU|nr:STAS domain-containing protein [Pseudonocardia humida]MCO1653923.1 STAS domain-containing protein [Pseudonocardia humida]